ncbi:head scaffolding protein [Variovorax phage VAC_51]|uniref:Head scaffolding protein n=1 Tax=Variovorax phage VAC_51 TaxID=2985242 RepID=A0A9N6WSW6_9CAUD|nr:head scaffolding protein [Variovorax phage VAC_51]
MAEQVAIPAGVNPNSATPAAGAEVTTYGTRANAGNPAAGNDPAGLPALPSSSEQRPGHQPSALPPGVDAAQFAAFVAWQATQGKGTPTPEAKPNPTPTAPPASLQLFSEVAGSEAALAATKAASASDPVIATTFEMFSLVAPDLNLVRAIGLAIDRGDSDLIDRAYLREAGGDKADKLIKLAEGMVKHVDTQVTNMQNEIHLKAGGQAQWDANAASFNTSAPAYLKAYVKEALNSADAARIRQGVDAVLEFVKASGNLPKPPQGHVRAGGGAPDGVLGLSKQGYQEARQKLNKFDRDYNDKARELDARRAIGKKMGL